MNEPSHTSLEVDQLGNASTSWPEVISSFENLIVEIDNRSARAVQMLSRITTAIHGFGLADEEGSFHADLTSLKKTYAIQRNESVVPDPRLEFDYEEFPGLVRIWDVCSMDRENLSALMGSLFSEERLSLDVLRRDRCQQSPRRPQCPCCEENSKERARYASMHPLFDILMRATRRPDVLQIRVLSPFADLSVSLLPYRVEADNGILTAIDKDRTSAFHVDLRWLHAMRIKQVELDGTNYAMIIGYDSFGTELFHIASPDADDTDAWTQCCEWSKQFFSR